MSLFKLFRGKVIMAVICMIVSLQVFNSSFDPVDSHTGIEDLTINEIESCLELVLEIILDRENAIEETDESDEAPNKPGTSLILFPFHKPVVLKENPSESAGIQHGSYKHTQAKSLSLSITPPPPKKIRLTSF